MHTRVALAYHLLALRRRATIRRARLAVAVRAIDMFRKSSPPHHLDLVERVREVEHAECCIFVRALLLLRARWWRGGAPRVAKLVSSSSSPSMRAFRSISPPSRTPPRAPFNFTHARVDHVEGLMFLCALVVLCSLWWCGGASRVAKLVSHVALVTVDAFSAP